MSNRSKPEILWYLFAEIEAIRPGAWGSAERNPDQRIIQDLGLDSLDYATLMLGCETWSGTRVSDRAIEWARVQTVGQLADLFVGGVS